VNSRIKALSPENRLDILLAGAFILLVPVKLLVEYCLRADWATWATFVTFSLKSCLYILVILMLYTVRSHLDEYHIDAISLILLIAGLVFRPIVSGIPWLSTSLVLISLVFCLLLFWALLKKQFKLFIPPKLWLWMTAGLLICLGEYFVLRKLFTFLAPPFSRDQVTWTIVYIIDNFFNVALLEEAVIRGFFWGSLRKKGIADLDIWLIQAFLFMALHFDLIVPRSWVGYLSALILGLVSGFLAWKSRSILPGAIPHTFHNIVGYLILRR
jgi:membrane protease YdiL (CAAX protease family)